ncbi:MAG: DUF5668 domain-containing protein [Dehalococcoidia bacterium]
MDDLNYHSDGHARRFDVGAALAGLVFVVLGVLFLLEALEVANFRFEVVLPVIVIALGVAAIVGALVGGRRD